MVVATASWPSSVSSAIEAVSGASADTASEMAPVASSARNSDTGSVRLAPPASTSAPCEVPGVASTVQSPISRMCDTSSSGSWIESGSVAVFQSWVPRLRSAVRTCAGVASGRVDL
jgi:hypothetical protein